MTINFNVTNNNCRIIEYCILTASDPLDLAHEVTTRLEEWQPYGDMQVRPIGPNVAIFYQTIVRKEKT